MSNLPPVHHHSLVCNHLYSCRLHFDTHIVFDSIDHGESTSVKARVPVHMAPQPRAHTSPPKPWEQRAAPGYQGSDPAVMSNASGTAPTGPSALHQRHVSQSVVLGENGRRVMPGGDVLNRYSSARGSGVAARGAAHARSLPAVGSTSVGTDSTPTETPGGQPKSGQGIPVGSNSTVTAEAKRVGMTEAANGATGAANGAGGLEEQQWKQQGAPGTQGASLQGPGTHGSGYRGYSNTGYGANRYGTTYSTGYGGNYGNTYSGGGYGG